jgi:hypothetical protein
MVKSLFGRQDSFKSLKLFTAFSQLHFTYEIESQRVVKFNPVFDEASEAGVNNLNYASRVEKGRIGYDSEKDRPIRPGRGKIVSGQSGNALFGAFATCD